MSNCFRRKGGCLVLALVAAGVVFLAVARPSAARAERDPWRQQAIAEFVQWRDSIPDYEKRLYDRVKRTNSRTVRLTNLVIGGFLVTILVLGIGFWLLLSRIRLLSLLRPPMPATTGTDPSASPPPHAQAGVLQQENFALLLRIEENQRLLRQAVDGVSEYFREAQAHEEGIQWLRRSAAKHLKELDAGLDTLDGDPAKRIRKEQSELAKVLGGLDDYCHSAQAQALGLSRLVASAEAALTRLDADVRDASSKVGGGEE